MAVSCQGPPPGPGGVTILLNNQAGGFVTHAIYVMPTTFNLVLGDLESGTASMTSWPLTQT